MLPNLSAAADVARWTELSFNRILGRSEASTANGEVSEGKTDKRQQRDPLREPLRRTTE